MKKSDEEEVRKHQTLIKVEMIKTSHPQNYFKERKAKLIKLIQAEQIQVMLIQAK
jgi:hypothetical protein